MFTEKHVKAVSERLREYEKVLASKEFVRLEMCDVCETVRDRDKGTCTGCLFHHCDDNYGFSNCMTSKHARIGSRCVTKEQQLVQFQYLLGQLDKNGWEFR